MNEQEFWSAIQPIEIKPVIHRLYYNDQGLPLFFSQEELSGNYINVDAETFFNPPTHIRVIDGKLTIIDTCVVTRLTLTNFGVACHPHDISIVVEENLPNKKWNLV
jgi:hypothetical protein